MKLERAEKSEWLWIAAGFFLPLLVAGGQVWLFPAVSRIAVFVMMTIPPFATSAWLGHIQRANKGRIHDLTGIRVPDPMFDTARILQKHPQASVRNLLKAYWICRCWLAFFSGYYISWLILIFVLYFRR